MIHETEASAAVGPPEPLPRSPELMSVDDTAVLVVDVQGKLATLIPRYEQLVARIALLIDGARILILPLAVTEQYPQGLGPTVPSLAERLPPATPKLAFSCGECAALWSDWTARGIRRVLIVGIETHVCIAQTVFDLLAYGLRVYIAVDAVGARHALDHDVALRRLEASGATPTTVEAALFEWCVRAGSPQFKQISALIKAQSPVS